jgi:aminoglycoside 3-N-acetyltransferase
MRERSVVERTDRPRTVTSIARDLRALGVKRGMTLLVHSSLSSMGWVAGGAQAVIEALGKVLGATGTLVMPAHSGDFSDPVRWENPPVPKQWWPEIRKHWPAFDAAVTPTRGMGAIAECFRSLPSVIRSDHPQESFAARGPNARTITAEHALDYGMGERSPLARLYDLDAHVLLLGVGYRNCTSAHLAEYRTEWPGKAEFHDGAAVLVNGKRRWVRFNDVDGSDEDFDTMGAAFERSVAGVRSGSIGSAPSKLFRQRALVDFAVEWLRENRIG